MISIIIPVFNEEKNILGLLQKVKNNLSSDDQIIVVDDGSEDKTVEIVNQFQCDLIKNGTNIGKGQSLINGIQQSKGDIIFFIDGDGQDDPREIPKLLSKLNEGYDFVIGSRFIPEANKIGKRYDQKALSPVNFIGNKCLTFLINILFNLNIYDTQSGFKCFKADKLKSLNLVSKRYEIETEIIIKSKKKKLKVTEVPVYRYARVYGASSLFDVPFGRIKFMIRVIKVIIFGYIKWK